MKNIRRMMAIVIAVMLVAVLPTVQPVQAQSLEAMSEGTEGVAATDNSATAENAEVPDGSAGTVQEPEGENAESVQDGTEAVEESAQNTEVQTSAEEEAGKESLAKSITIARANGDTIANGICIGDVDVSGKTVEEAEQAVAARMDELKNCSVTLNAIEGNQVTITAGDMGLSWTNPEVIGEAVELGKKGNVVQRYKALQDLRHESKVFDLKYDFDKELIRQILIEQCGQYNAEAQDAVLTRVDGVFSVTPGKTGYVIDEEASLAQIYNTLTSNWSFDNTEIDLAAKVDEPRGSEAELLQVKDVLGTFSTNFKSSGKARSANVTNGCTLISGMTLYPGDEFSMYEAVAPFSEENGYYMAGSYLNGQVVDSLGGGICQVSTTLYNAVLLAELEVTERHNHSMIVSYVDPSADAAIAESAGKDFKFVNNTEHPIYIDGYVENKNITFTIYGVETRPENRTVTYESKVLSVTQPEADVIYTDVAMPLGQVVSQSAHVGYKAELWKIVTEDGVEVSREQINSSSYKMVPRTATVGLSTNDVNAYNEMLAAVATNNIDHVKNVAAALAAAQAQQPSAPVEQQPAAPVEQQPAAPVEQQPAPVEPQPAPAQ